MNKKIIHSFVHVCDFYFSFDILKNVFFDCTLKNLKKFFPFLRSDIDYLKVPYLSALMSQYLLPSVP